MPNENQIEQTRVQSEIVRAFEDLGHLVRSESDFDTFCETMLAEAVRLTGAHAALLWQVNGQEIPQLSHRTESAKLPIVDQVVDAENLAHTRAVAEVLQAKQPVGLDAKQVSPSTLSQSGEAEQSILLLFSPILDLSGNAHAVVELVQRGGISTATQEGYLRFLVKIARLFQQRFEQRELAHLKGHSQRSIERTEFISQVHRSLDPTETAYAIANEARKFLKCDRVSVAKWNGRHCKVVAISSQDRFDNRSNVVKQLGQVATSSVKADMPFWITGDTDGIAPKVASQINLYLDEAESRTLVVLPLAKQATPADASSMSTLKSQKRKRALPRKLGALVIEYIDADIKEAEIGDQCNLIVKEAEFAMENSRNHNEIFLRPIFKRLGWLQNCLFRDHFAKTMTGLAALAILTAFLIFFPQELKMKVDGVMHPKNRKTVFSQTEGIIRFVAIDERSEVKKDDVLLRLENSDLDLQVTDAELRLETIQHQIDDAIFRLGSNRVELAEKSEIGSSLELLRKRQTNLNRQMELMKERKSLQTITSPIAGTVVTPQPQRRLVNLPATPNLAVLEIAQLDGPWQLELSIPQNKLGYVIQALEDNDGEPIEVEFRIGTNPNLVLEGHLTAVAIKALTSEAGSTEFRAIVEADGDQFQELGNELRIGAGVTAKVHCGTRRLGFVCFYQIIDWMRTRVFF